MEDDGHKVDTLEDEVRITMVGKYTGLSDSYLSVIKALQHSAFAVGRKLQIDWIESTDLDPNDRQIIMKKHGKCWSQRTESWCLEDLGIVG